MTPCAATTTIRQALWDEYREHEALAALASLEQLVEAAQRWLHLTDIGDMTDDIFVAEDAFRAALAAVGPELEPQ